MLDLGGEKGSAAGCVGTDPLRLTVSFEGGVGGYEADEMLIEGERALWANGMGRASGVSAAQHAAFGGAVETSFSGSDPWSKPLERSNAHYTGDTHTLSLEAFPGLAVLRLA